MRIRVTRTLVYEGEEEWVNETIARSYIQIGVNIGHKLETPNGTIEEVSRSVVELDGPITW